MQTDSVGWSVIIMAYGPVTGHTHAPVHVTYMYMYVHTCTCTCTCRMTFTYIIRFIHDIYEADLNHVACDTPYEGVSAL